MDRVEAGGFDNLALNASVFGDGNVTLAMRQSLRLSGLTLRADAPAASVDLRATCCSISRAMWGCRAPTSSCNSGPSR